MKSMLMAIMAVAVAVTFSAPAFAGDEGKKKPADGGKGEQKLRLTPAVYASDFWEESLERTGSIAAKTDGTGWTVVAQQPESLPNCPAQLPGHAQPANQAFPAKPGNIHQVQWKTCRRHALAFHGIACAEPTHWNVPVPQ